MGPLPTPSPIAHARPLSPLALAAPNPTARSHDDPADAADLHLRPLFHPIFPSHPPAQDADENEDGSSFSLRPLFQLGRRRSASMKPSGMLNLGMRRLQQLGFDSV